MGPEPGLEPTTSSELRNFSRAGGIAEKQAKIAMRFLESLDPILTQFDLESLDSTQKIRWLPVDGLVCNGIGLVGPDLRAGRLTSQAQRFDRKGL